MAKCMEIKCNNPDLKQSDIAREMKLSSSILQRYARDRNMRSPYRIPLSSNTHTRNQKTSNHNEHDLKMTSNDLKMSSSHLKMTSKNVN